MSLLYSALSDGRGQESFQGEVSQEFHIVTIQSGDSEKEQDILTWALRPEIAWKEMKVLQCGWSERTQSHK